MTRAHLPHLPHRPPARARGWTTDSHSDDSDDEESDDSEDYSDDEESSDDEATSDEATPDEAAAPVEAEETCTQVAVVPVGGVETGDGSSPTDPTPALVVILGASALGVGAVVRRTVRQSD